MTNIDKLENFFKRELSGELKDLMFIAHQPGEYELFGKYILSKTPQGFFKAQSKTTDHAKEFSTMRNAVSWCIFENAKKYRESNRLADLDMRISSKEVDIAIHKRLLKIRQNSNERLLYAIKLEEDTIKKKLMVKELESYINTSKNIQTQKFDKKKQPNFSRFR